MRYKALVRFHHQCCIRFYQAFTRLYQGCIRFYLGFVGVSSGPYTALSVYKGFAEFILRVIRAWQGFIKLYRALRGFSCKGFEGSGLCRTLSGFCGHKGPRKILLLC